MPSVNPGEPTLTGNWQAASSGSTAPDFLRQLITPGVSLDPSSAIELHQWHDFEVDASSATGNLFDILADVDWTHSDGTTVRQGRAFYTGSGTSFVFRFGSDKTGDWTSTTSSPVPELDGLTFNVSVTTSTNTNRSGFHVFDPANPTWWMQQKGPNGDPVRIAPRLVMWDGPTEFWDDMARLQSQIDLWSDTYAFTGAHPNNIVERWFDVEQLPVGGNWGLENLTADASPDPRCFEALEQLIDRWLDKGGHVHLWQWGDEERDGAPTVLPGGEHGALAQRLDRYISARLGPVPGWSMGYGFDLNEWTDASNLGMWIDRINTRIGWHHPTGGRYSENDPDPTNSGIYTSAGVNFNTGTTSPPQYASWEQHWASMADRTDPPQTIINDITTLLGNGTAAVGDRPPFSEDRFRKGVSPSQNFDSDSEVPTVIRAFGLSGWAAVYGNVEANGGSHEVTSGEWSNPAAIKAANDEVTAAMEQS